MSHRYHNWTATLVPGVEKCRACGAVQGQIVAPHSVPDFDGETYVRERDHVRLGAQLQRVKSALSDGAWHTLAELHSLTGDPESSISARLRDLRKPKFGALFVEHDALGGGLWRYRWRRPA